MTEQFTTVAAAGQRCPSRVWPAANFVDRLYLGYFLVLGLCILLLRQRVQSWPWYLAFHSLSLLVIAGLAWRAPHSRLWGFLHDWYPLLAFIVCFEEVSRLSFLLRGRWQDGHLLTLEARLFAVPPTVWLGRLASPVVTELLEAGYFSYFLLLIIVGGALYRRADKCPFRQVMSASVLGYMLCYLVFILFPTEGPAYTLRAQHTVQFSGGLFHWVVLQIQKHAGVHGNAFPSSHVAAGVVALIFAWRYTRRLAVGLAPLVILLCIGAVYDRYHYLSDVIAGIGFGALPALFVLKAGRKNPR